MTPPNDPYLLTPPGPLTTSLSVKQAMLHDWGGSWDNDFNELTAEVCARLLRVAGGRIVMCAFPCRVAVPLRWRPRWARWFPPGTAPRWY